MMFTYRIKAVLQSVESATHELGNLAPTADCNGMTPVQVALLRCASDAAKLLAGLLRACLEVGNG